MDGQLAVRGCTIRYVTYDVLRPEYLPRTISPFTGVGEFFKYVHCILSTVFILLTIMLTAKADGTKLGPFVLLNRKRPIKELEQFRGQLIIKYEGTNWMNDDLTEMYIKEVIDKKLFGRRLLVWDSFKCNINPRAKQLLIGRNVNMAVVSGGCTKFVQPADVSWIKPFKDRFREFYDEWMENGEKTYTKGGNMRARL